MSIVLPDCGRSVHGIACLFPGSDLDWLITLRLFVLHRVDGCLVNEDPTSHATEHQCLLPRPEAAICKCQGKKSDCPAIKSQAQGCVMKL